MSLFKPNRRFVLAALTALAGCGYGPAYGPAGVAGSLPYAISVDPPSDREEFLFVEQLERRLGRPEIPQYRLSYQIDTRQQGVGVTPSQEIFRYNVVGKATFTLRDVKSDAVVTFGSVDVFTSYSVASIDSTATPPSTGATISSVAAERDAYSRLMVILADQLVTRLIATAGSWRE